MDPLRDLIGLLRPRAALFGGGLDARGQWGVAFRKRDDLLFCWVEVGECCLIRSGCAPIVLQQGDFALIYTSTPFVLASDIAVKPVDSEAAVAAANNVWLKLGKGSDRPVTLRAGKFLVNKANESLLANLLPPVIHLKSGDASLGRIHSLLVLNETEARRPGPASEFIIERLVELILVEIMRTRQLAASEGTTGMLVGLVNPLTARALDAMHQNVAHGWTVDELAKLCAVSRSTFAAKFRRIVGVTPIEYLSSLRMAIAKDALLRGAKTVSEIAFSIGFQSASAFTTAFTRAEGCSPTQFSRSKFRDQ